MARDTEMNIETEAEGFLRRFKAAPPEARESLRHEARDLAKRLRSAAIDLSAGKATEFSPSIPRLILRAAQVALLAYGAGSPGLEPFERDVYYYNAFDPPDPIVAEYDRFKDRT